LPLLPLRTLRTTTIAYIHLAIVIHVLAIVGSAVLIQIPAVDAIASAGWPGRTCGTLAIVHVDEAVVIAVFAGIRFAVFITVPTIYAGRTRRA
jgi:hypothetical protein